MNVKVGDQVEQGDALAKAGESLFNEEAGVHVHFEIRKDGMPVNPLDYFNKPLSSLQELDTTDKANAEENSGATEGNDEAAPSEDKSSEESGKTEDEGSAEEPAEKTSLLIQKKIQLELLKTKVKLTTKLRKTLQLNQLTHNDRESAEMAGSFFDRMYES
jgi:hypothetical protein